MGWNWLEVGPYFTLTAFIIITAIVAIAFHHTPLLSEWFPESCVLILLGIAVGAILKLIQSGEARIPLDCNELVTRFPAAEIAYHGFPVFTPELFFYILLPPVILESAYSLYDTNFASNIGTILLYAVVGTLMNTFMIGPLLYGLNYIGWMGNESLVNNSTMMNVTMTNVTMTNVTMTNVTMTNDLGLADSLVFSSLISAVDPVAVLAIFQETRIDRNLYFLVFGESLLNDAITVGLYHTMLHYAEGADSPEFGEMILACLKLIAVGVVGLIIGVVFGLFTALLTKTTAHVRVLEPLLMLGFSYMSYITAELFEFSGIIGIIGCGLVQAHYAMKNISTKSYTTVKYFTKMQSAISEAVIFLFLGMALLTDDHLLHVPFIVWTLILCLAGRFIGVFSLTWIANRRRVRHISCVEQFIMAYGGLRGAVCFSLVHMLDPCKIQVRSLFLTTSLTVIFFTVFIQGTTIKPLMNIFHIKKSADKSNGIMLLDIHDNLGELMLAGVEQITGITGQFSLFNKIRSWDQKFLQKWFLCPGTEPSVLRAFRKHAILDLQEGAVPSGVNPQQLQPKRTKSSVEERIQLRKMLGTSRPMSHLRHHIDEDDDEEMQRLNTSSMLRRHKSQLISAKRLQTAMLSTRQTRVPDSPPMNFGFDEA